MIKFEPGSHQYSLISILSVVGEIPTSALNLMGNSRTMPDLVRRLSKRHKVVGENGESIENCRIIKVIGKGNNRRVRLHKSGLSLLDWIDMKEYYMSVFHNNKFSGSIEHINRNFRNAEAVIMFTKIGVEFRPQMLPKLQCKKKLNQVLEGAAFYPARLVKVFQDDGEDYKKLAFSRIVGMLVSYNEAYAVYNFREEWKSTSLHGENKILQAIQLLLGYNYCLKPKISGIIIGDDFDVAREILLLSHLDRRRKINISSLCENVHFIPKTEFGIRMLRFFSIQNFKSKIKSRIYEQKYLDAKTDEFEYDICKDDLYYLSILDGDIGRMERFWNFLNAHKQNGVVICYPEQEKMVKSYFGKMVAIQKINISIIEKILEVDKRGLFDE